LICTVTLKNAGDICWVPDIHPRGKEQVTLWDWPTGYGGIDSRYSGRVVRMDISRPPWWMLLRSFVNEFNRVNFA